MMVGRKSQRKKVASPPKEDPMMESSISTPQAGHTEPESQPDPPTVMHTVSQSIEPDLPPSYSPDQAQFARMSIDDGME